MNTAFDRALREHKDAVYRQLYRMCGNHEDAEDVLVETMTKAYRAMRDLRDEESVRAWLVQIGRRTCGRLRSRVSNQVLVPLDAIGEIQSNLPDAEALVVENELKTCLQSAMVELPDHYRDVYQLVDLQGLSLQEAADQLGLSLANTKSRLHRARSALRDLVDDSIGCLSYV